MTEIKVGDLVRLKDPSAQVYFLSSPGALPNGGIGIVLSLAYAPAFDADRLVVLQVDGTKITWCEHDLEKVQDEV